MKLEPNKEIITENLMLRKPEISFDFANRMFKAVDDNREHILPWLDWAMKDVTKSAEDDFKFALMADEDWNAGKRFEYSIFDKISGQFLGGVGIMQRGRFKDYQYEIGYWLIKDACGKGYLQEAIKQLENEFFGLGVQRLVIRNDIKNIKSKNVAERLGYVFEGVQRKSRYSDYLKEFMDANVFSKLKEDWAK